MYFTPFYLYRFSHTTYIFHHSLVFLEFFSLFHLYIFFPNSLYTYLFPFPNHMFFPHSLIYIYFPIPFIYTCFPNSLICFLLFPLNTYFPHSLYTYLSLFPSCFSPFLYTYVFSPFALYTFSLFLYTYMGFAILLVHIFSLFLYIRIYMFSPFLQS